MVKPYYIYGCSVYYIYEQILLHLWLSGFITFVVKSGWYYIYGFYYIYGSYTLYYEGVVVICKMTANLV